MKLSISEMTKLETLINKAEGTDVSVIIQMIKAKQRKRQPRSSGPLFWKSWETCQCLERSR